MKKIFIVLLFLTSVPTFAQQERELNLNKGINLIEAIYFHDNGTISQMGFYTLDGKLQGNWISFNTEGKKIVSANYNNGKKVGKWFYWNNKTLKEVDYTENAIVNVSEWKNKNALADN